MSEAPWRAHTFLAVGLTGKTQRYSRGTVGIVGIVSPCSARAYRRRASVRARATNQNNLCCCTTNSLKTRSKIARGYDHYSTETVAVFQWLWLWAWPAHELDRIRVRAGLRCRQDDQHADHHASISDTGELTCDAHTHNLYVPSPAGLSRLGVPQQRPLGAFRAGSCLTAVQCRAAGVNNQEQSTPLLALLQARAN